MLAALERLQFSGRWEVVLVDNGSTDRTAEMLRDFADNTAMDIKLAFEARPGLAVARNCGIRNSRGALLAFTDDDCYPAPDFLTRVTERLSDSDLAYCGGQVLLFDPTDRPITIQTRNEPLHIPADKFLQSGFIHGANMAFKRERIIEVCGFDERLGAGTFFKSGEDTDLLRRLAWNGGKGYFDPAIRVEHDHGRKTFDQEKTLLRGYERGIAAVFAKFCIYHETRPIGLRQFYWYLRQESLPRALRLCIFAFEFARRVRFSSQRAWNHPSAISCNRSEE